MKSLIDRFGLYFAWIVSLIATGGSLYFSEVLGFVPCVLCWYQRILMYPLIILLGIATYRQDKKISIYALPLALIGLAISLYHIFIQIFPHLASEASCKAGVPCTADSLNLFGFITIPMLAGAAFLLISITLVFTQKSAK
ncbi:disulfide oxidoreductase [Shimazuella kribbensis]|uniref:disulfide oxidoreductase n=1 Tax=Shimazuella kribbensis TaxID=139808 RepID=UPI000427F38E|nr:disulfide oxidoreductase [Shimazuella kribbensis]